MENYPLLLYRKKYNLSLNDERLLKLSEMEIIFDSFLNMELDERIKNIEEDDEEEIDLGDIKEIENFNDMKNSITGNFKVNDFDEEEVDKFWNSDDIYNQQDEKINKEK